MFSLPEELTIIKAFQRVLLLLAGSGSEPEPLSVSFPNRTQRVPVTKNRIQSRYAAQCSIFNLKFSFFGIAAVVYNSRNALAAVSQFRTALHAR